jgi:hypothetical protein
MRLMQKTGEAMCGEFGTDEERIRKGRPKRRGKIESRPEIPALHGLRDGHFGDAGVPPSTVFLQSYQKRLTPVPALKAVLEVDGPHGPQHIGGGRRACAPHDVVERADGVFLGR